MYNSFHDQLKGLSVVSFTRASPVRPILRHGLPPPHNPHFQERCGSLSFSLRRHNVPSSYLFMPPRQPHPLPNVIVVVWPLSNSDATSRALSYVDRSTAPELSTLDEQERWEGKGKKWPTDELVPCIIRKLEMRSIAGVGGLFWAHEIGKEPPFGLWGLENTGYCWKCS